MVISVPSSQGTEIFKLKPSPIYSFVDNINEMVEITPPRANKQPCKLAVMKYKRASK